MATPVQNNTYKVQKNPTRKKLDLIRPVKYNNTLPDPPFDLKFISNNISPLRFIKYQLTSLEQSHKFEIHPDINLGRSIDLVDKGKYLNDNNDQMDSADEELLEEDIVAPLDCERSKNHSKSVAWLRRTEYISTEKTRFQPQTHEKLEAKLGLNIKQNFKNETFYVDREIAMNAIEKTFEENKKPIKKHPSKPNVYAVETLNIFPDFKNWKYPCAHVIFDTDPAPKSRSVHDQMEKMSQAMIRGVVDESGDQYVAYFLPSEETIIKRGEDAAKNRRYDEDNEYEYEMANEYDWNVPGKGNKSNTENYFFNVRSDGIFYNELETRTRLNKRRTKVCVKNSYTDTIKTKLIVRHVPMSKQELIAQKLREMQLQPYNEDEEEKLKRKMNAAKESVTKMVIKNDDGPRKNESKKNKSRSKTDVSDANKQKYKGIDVKKTNNPKTNCHALSKVSSRSYESDEKDNYVVKESSQNGNKENNKNKFANQEIESNRKKKKNWKN